MSYTALYRKFRPQCFEDVKGQDHIVTTLKNQIKLGRIGHAYLFCGTRGTGKTTIAKIFARAINCENPQDGNPCCQCASCQAVAAGNSMNVIEIDAASNNGVENVRGIIEEVAYAPVDAKYKVYIIDEVHMITAAAFNALLKTLEEPPAYAVFIMATTDPQKILTTVLSRCQRYDFKRIGIETISDRMKELMGIEQADVEDRALKYIARAADGSMRDALSLLDQCLAFHYGKTLTYDMALDVLGAVDTTVFSQMLRLVLEDDIIGAVDLLEKVVMQGRELTQFVTDFIWYLRNLMLLMSSDSDDIEDVLEMSTEHIARLREESEMLDLETVFRYITVFSDLSAKMKYSTQKRIMVEMTIVKLCRPQMGITGEDMHDRVRQLEAKLEKIETGAIKLQAEVNSSSHAAAEAVPDIAPIIPDALPEDIKRAGSNWGAIRSMLTEPLLGLLKDSHLSTNADNTVIYVCVNDPMKEKLIKLPARLEELDQAFVQYVGKKVAFEIRCYDNQRNFEDQYSDLVKALGAVIEDE